MSNQIDPFAWSNSHDYKRSSVMEVNGLKAVFHMPKAREKTFDAQGNESSQSLPEGNQRPAFTVDKYPACPDNWMHGSGLASSYFVPILPEHGMWLDFNMNMYHTHDVAVVLSIQGVNPLTGLKSDPIRLEQYRNMCPKHQREFKQDLFCEDCKFKWHPQNYLSSNNGSPFWIDGFRTEDGTIRQWYFTEEECKGIAAQIIGKDRVFAIGLAFYLSKQPKPKPQVVYRGFVAAGGGSGYTSGGYGSYGSSYEHFLSSNSSTIGSASIGSSNRRTRSSVVTQSCLTKGLETVADLQADVASTQKTLEIGAGAKIFQQINRDPQNLDYWQEDPAGFIYINYCDVETSQKIIAAGTREELQEGFLAGLETK